jgi:putative SOS response-associated peptidase YedK
MCGRIVQDFPSVHALEAFFGPLVAERLIPRHFNLGPGQPAAVIRQLGELGTQRRIDLLQWGLVAPDAPNLTSGPHPFNARAETLTERRAFREPFVRRRCVVPASGFYEWKQSGTVRQPLYFHLAQGAPLAFAGLWETWRGAEGQALETFTIVTVPPNALVASIPDRMPAMLLPDQVTTWLSPSAEASGLQRLLLPYAGNDLNSHPVSPRLNDGRVDDPSCIEPVAERQLSLF